MKHQAFSLLAMLAIALSACAPAALPDTPTVSPSTSVALLSSATPAPSDTPTRKPSWTPHPTGIRTATNVLPTETFTPSEVPTLTTEPVISTIGLAGACRQRVDKLHSLSWQSPLPTDLANGEGTATPIPPRQPDVLDINTIFSVFEHLQLQSGYKLDTLIFGEGLANQILIYAIKKNEPPFTSLQEFQMYHGVETTDESVYSGSLNNSEFLDHIVADSSPEGYLDFVLLSLYGYHYYLLPATQPYEDTFVVCDASDRRWIETELNAWQVPMPDQLSAAIDLFDYTPTVSFGETTATIRFVTFSKWEGLVEHVNTLTRQPPHRLIIIKHKTLFKYDVGFRF